MFGKILRFLMFFFFVFFLVSKTKTLKGYGVDQAVFFYLTFNIIDTTAQLLFREVYRFRPLVVSGELDTILVKPFHPFLRILVGGVDFLDLIMLIPYLILTLFFAGKIGSFSFVNLLFYFGLLTNALILATAFHVFVLALGILTTEVDHTIMIYRDLTSLGRFPMEIYKEPIRGFFTFIIPVGIMMSFPSKALFGLLSPSLILFSFLLSFVFLTTSLKLWGVAIEKYQSWGG
jgi:ABC-2 type transport system permease protein